MIELATIELVAIAVGCFFLGMFCTVVYFRPPTFGCKHEYNTFDLNGWHCRFNYNHIKKAGS